MNITGLGAFRVRTFAFAVAACFAVSGSNHAGAVGAASPSPLQPVSELPSGEAPGSEAALLPLRQVRPAGSVGADLPSLSTPAQPSTDDGSSEGIFPGLGASMRRSLASKGESLLTPSSVVAALEQGRRGIDTGALVTGFGTDLAQNMIDHSLSQARDKFLGGWVKGLNLSYSPSFSGRESLLQADAVLSLHDDSSNSLMAQFGLQSRDGEAAGNLGAIWRHRLSADALLGLNTFYDYLSDPSVDRWSLGGEVLYRSFALSMNFYRGLGEERKDGREHYSPDGWDIELGGSLDAVPWLEYSARYYHWDVERASDLKGSDYKITLRPIPLVGLSLRYDSPDVGDEEFGFEGVLQYRFDLSAEEQTKLSDSPRSAGAVWQRRFERVRREYEQRVQSHAISPSRIPPIVGSTPPQTSCSFGSCTVTLPVVNPPPAATQPGTQVVVRLTNAVSPTAPVVGAGATTSGLLRQSSNCAVVGAAGGITCSYNAATGTVTVSGLVEGSYNFALEFMNPSGASLGRVNIDTVSVVDTPAPVPVASISVGSADGSSVTITESGGVARVTVSLDNEAPTGGLMVNLTSSGTADIGADYSHTGLTDANQGRYTLLIPPGQMSANFLLTAMADSDPDDNETAIFTLSAGSGYNLDGSLVNAVTVTISGTDAFAVPVVSLRSSDDAVSEGGSATTVTVNLSAPAPAGGLTVNISASGTAVAGTDYSLSGSSLSGTAPDYTVTVIGSLDSAQLTLGAVDDSVHEGGMGEYVTLTVVEGEGYLVGASVSSISSPSNPSSPSSMVTVRIMDDDPDPAHVPAASIATDVAAITEAVGSPASNVATFTVTLTAAPGTGNTISVNLILNGTATLTDDYSVAGTDLTAGADGSYTLAFGATDVMKAFMVTSVDDNPAEDPSETVEFSIAPGSDYRVADFPMDVASVTIVDSADTAGISSSQLGAITLDEGASASYTLVLDTRPSAPVTVAISSSRQAAVTVATPRLEFTASNWNTPQTVTVRSPADSVSSNTPASISYVISGGGYDSVTLDPQPVTVENVTLPPVTGLAASPADGGGSLSWHTPAEVTMVRISATVGGVTFDLNGIGVPLTALTPSVLAGSRGSEVLSGLTNGTEYEISVASMDANGNTSAAVTTTLTPAVQAAPVLSMASAASTVAEGDSVTIRIRFDGILSAELPVAYTISGSATSADYMVGSTTQFRIPADTNGNPGVGGNPPGFTLSARLDSATEGSETVVFTLTAPAGSGYTLGSQTTHTVTITDASLTTASVSIMGATDPQAAAITEATTSQMSTVTVSLTAAAPDGGLEVTIARSGTATPTDDFTVAGVTPTSGAGMGTNPLGGSDPRYTVTVPATATTAQFTVMALDDIVDDEDETIEFTVVTGAGYDVASGAAAAVTLTVTNNPLPMASIGTSSPTINEEGETSATVTVMLSRMPGRDVTVNLLLGGTATPVEDYALTGLTANDAGDYTLAFAATDMMKTFMVAAVDDGVSTDDGSETVAFGLTVGDGYTVPEAPEGFLAITIIDKDAAGITSSQFGVLTLTEGGSATYTLVLNRQPSASADVTVTVTVASDDPSDDQAVTVSPASLTFNATTDDPVSGTTSGWNVPQTVTVSAAANRAGARATLTYTVASTDNSYGSLSLEDQAQSVTVRDAMVPAVTRLTATAAADRAVTLEWMHPSGASNRVMVSATDPSGMAVDLDDASVNDHIVVTPTDVSATSRSHVIIPAGRTPELATGEYTFRVAALDTPGNLSEERSVTVQVGMADPVLNFESATATVDEGGTATVRLLYNGTLASNLVVDYEVGGSATLTDDYTPSASGTAITVDSATQELTITSGSEGTPGAMTKPAQFTIALAADMLTEGPETLELTLMDGDGYIVGSTYPTYTLTIGDTSLSEASIHIGAADTQMGTIAEMGAENSGEVTVMLENTPSTDVTVNLSVTGNAVLGTDYSQTGLNVSGSDFTLRVPAGRASASFSLTAMSDADVVNEEIVFTIDRGAYTVAAAPANAATMLIIDDEDDTAPPPVTGLTAMVGNAAVTLNWTNPPNPPVDFAGVRISATTGGTIVDINGDALDNDRMVAAPAATTSISGLMNGSIYTFTAVALDYAGNASMMPATVEVTVGPRLSFSSATANVDEGDMLTVTLMIEGAAPVSDVTVSYAISGANVTTGDYGAFVAGVLTNPTATSFTLPMGTAVGSSPTFTIPITEDMVTEGEETMTLTLTLGAGYGLGSQTTHTVTIDDESLSEASVYIGASSPGAQMHAITEAGGTSSSVTTATPAATATVTVALTNAHTLAPGTNVVVNLMRTDSGAVLDTDFAINDGSSVLGGSGTARTVAFAAGETTKRFTVTTIDDTTSEPAETVTFTVQAGTNYDPASDANARRAVITITDDDIPVATLGTSLNTITEARAGAGTPTHEATVTVTLTPPPTANTMVNVIRTVTGGTTVGAASDNDVAESGITIATSMSMQVGTVTVAPPTSGSPASTSATFTVTAVADSLYDGIAESVTYALATPGTGADYTLGSATTQTITITDAQSVPSATIGTSRTTITEARAGMGMTPTHEATVTVTLSGSADADTEVSVDRTVAGNPTVGAASDNDNDFNESIDFSSNMGTVTVPMGMPSITFTVTAVDDDLYDGIAESVTYTLATPGTGAGYTLGTTTEQTITITDGDSSTPTLSIAASPRTTITEGSTTENSTEVTITASPGLDDVGIRPSVSGFEPLGDASYFVTRFASLPIPSGGTTASITFTAKDDGDDTANETLTITLDSCVLDGGGACNVDTSNDTVIITIVDADGP